MEGLLKDFDVPPKNSSSEVLQKWRSAISLVRNPRRRFRFVADLAKRAEMERRKLEIQESLRVAVLVQKAVLQFTAVTGHKLSDEVREAGFDINPDEIEKVARRVNEHGGVQGLARRVSVSLSDGVSSDTTEIRKKVYGLNQHDEKASRTFFMFVWEALQDLTLMILIACALVSIAVGIPTEGWPSGLYDGLGIILSIFLVVTVTAVSDYKQSLQFSELDKEKRKIFVQVTRDGHRQRVLIYDLVVGDVVHLSIGDVVPADGALIHSHGLLVDESSLSGESEPVNVTHERPFLLCGSKVQDGSGLMMVTAVGMRTEWGKLMSALSEGGDDETPLQVKLNGVATVIGKVGLGFSVLTLLVLLTRFLTEKILYGDFASWGSADALKILNYFAIAVAIIVVAVPEGLPLAVTLSLAFAMRKLMSEKALVRHLSACETMGSATCICTDKTGTLTTNRMAVEKIWMCERVGEKHELQLRDSPEAARSILLQAIFQNTCGEVVGDGTVLGSPTESAMLELGRKLGGDFNGERRKANIVKIEPFNSVRKKMTVVTEHPDGTGFRTFCKGASEIILRSCDKLIDRNGGSAPMTEEKTGEVTSVINAFASEALRTLCFAFTDGGDGYTLIAIVGIKDPIRPGVKGAVKTCLEAGITVRMVTGDNINTARAIARECGILTAEGVAIEGSEFRSKTPEQLRTLIPRIQVMARSLPSDKLMLVNQLRKIHGEVVAVTGDGTNDAPALHEADIGLAMGIAGTEVAKESADVIILDDNFSTIVNVARWGRAVYINIQKFVQFQLTVNVVALVINFVSACVSGTAPLTAVQLLWVNLIMDTLGALALATEPPNESLMARQPVRRGESFITGLMWRNIIGQCVFQLAVLGTFNFFGKPLLKLDDDDDNATAVLNTFIFNAFVFCQVFNELNSREIEKVDVFSGIFSSWVFVGVIVSTVSFQIVIVEFLGTFASTVPLSFHLWLLSIFIGFASIPIAIIVKFIPVETVRIKSLHHHDGYQPLPAGPELA